jgi:hypothetical protein
MTIYLDGDMLRFNFRDYHEAAEFGLNFQQTLRIPDDGEVYPLPLGLGRFPLRHVDDYADKLPADWIRRGGVLFPMYQAEAMWITFETRSIYPFALKIAAGKINCINGELWDLELRRNRAEASQNYIVVPGQLWLDGYAVAKDTVRQFVAMPLGKGFSAEEQITGSAVWGGLQIAAYPLKREKFEQVRARLSQERERQQRVVQRAPMPAMGLAPGGKIYQQVFQDKYELEDWDTSAVERCFVSILNSKQWRAVTGEQIPTRPITANDYARHDLPWFDYYADKPSIQGTETLRSMEGIAIKAAELESSMAAELSDAMPVNRVIKLNQG